MHIKHTSILLTAITLTAFFCSCNEDPTQLGLDLLPSGDRIYIKVDSSVSVTSKSYEYPSVYSNADVVMLGKLNDPYFGDITASMYSEYFLDYLIPNYKKQIIADSIILQFVFDKTKFVGDTNSVMRYTVYKLTKPLSVDSSYTKSSNLDSYVDFSKILGVGEMNFHTDSIAIKLDLSYANLITIGDSASLRNVRDSLNLYGFYVKPEIASGKGFIPYADFTLRDVNNILKNELRLHFHTTTDTSAMHFKMIAHDYNQYDGLYHYVVPKANVVLNNFVTPTNDSILPMLSASGLKIKLDLSNLQQLKVKDGLLYNVGKADLLIPYDSSLYASGKTMVPMTTRFLLDMVSSTGFIYPYSLASTKTVINSDTVTFTGFKPYSDSYVNGTIDTINNNVVLNISQYVQEYLTGKTSVTELVLVPLNSSTELTSAFLKKDKNIKLKIKYSKQ